RRPVEGVEIAVQADVPRELLLIEIHESPSDRERGSEISSRDAPRPRAVEIDRVQRWELVRGPNGVDHLIHTAGTGAPGKSRAEDREPVVGEPARLGRTGRTTWCGETSLTGEAFLVRPPERTERPTVDPLEYAGPGGWQRPRRRFRQCAELLVAVLFGQISMEPEAVRVRGEATRPVGQTAVHAIQRLEPAGPGGFVHDGAKVSGVQPP